MTVLMSRTEKRFVNSKHRRQRVVADVDRFLQPLGLHPGQTFLDVGCGVGTAVRQAAVLYGLDAVGIDVDPDQVELAQQDNGAVGVRFMVGSATALPFSSHSFDIVMASKVLHHIPAWREAFDELVRVVKPGGHIIVKDLALPEWLASLSARLMAEDDSCITETSLIDRAKRHQLEPRYIGVRLGLLERVWRSPR